LRWKVLNGGLPSFKRVPNVKAPRRKFMFPNIKFGHSLFGQAENETSPH
jgi:hypothetical protein